MPPPHHNTQQWHPHHGLIPSNGKHPAMALSQGTQQWHPTMAPSNGTLEWHRPAMVPSNGTEQWHHVQSAKVVRRPPLLLEARTPIAIAIWGNIKSTWFRAQTLLGNSSKPLPCKSSCSRLRRFRKRPSGSVLNLLPCNDKNKSRCSKPSNTPAGSWVSVKFMFSKYKEQPQPHSPRYDVLMPSIDSSTLSVEVPSPANMPTGSELKLWFLRSRNSRRLRSAKGPQCIWGKQSGWSDILHHLRRKKLMNNKTHYPSTGTGFQSSTEERQNSVFLFLLLLKHANYINWTGKA